MCPTTLHRALKVSAARGRDALSDYIKRELGGDREPESSFEEIDARIKARGAVEPARPRRSSTILRESRGD